MVAILLGVITTPTTALQILSVNLITAVTLSLPLAFELPEQNVMQRLPPAREETGFRPLSHCSPGEGL